MRREDQLLIAAEREETKLFPSFFPKPEAILEVKFNTDLHTNTQNTKVSTEGHFKRIGALLATRGFVCRRGSLQEA